MIKSTRSVSRRLAVFCSILYMGAFCLQTMGQDNRSDQKLSALEKGFKQMPDSIQTSVYWYWMSDHISKKGVVKDLESMKKVGINRAFIGNIGTSEIPFGKVKILSDEWWDILHTALKTATDLGIEIGIFNSPGWSQSGGPWVKPEQAMRYLSLSETLVTGPVKLRTKLEKTSADFQDVKVIAYPVQVGSDRTVNVKNAKISSFPAVNEIDKIADGDKATEVTIPQGGKFIVYFSCNEVETVRSISISPSHRPIALHADVFAEDKLIKSFDVNRTNAELNVGFNPYGPVVIALPKVSSKSFRLVLSNANANSGIAEINLTACPMEERYIEKTLAKMHQTPLPYWPDYMWPAQPEADDQSVAIDPAKVLDLTDKMDKDGNISWNVPKGTWKIIRSGMVPTGTKNAPASPEAIGLETDKMSKEHIASHFDAFLGEIIRRIPAEDRKTWKVAVQDSYETGGQNWTDDFIAIFIERYGYSPVPYIPVFNGYVVGNRDLSDRFLWDLRRLIADKVSYDYVGGLREVCHKNGLRTWLENYGHWGFPGEFLQYGGQSDENGGEFWSEGELGNIENRAGSSCSHIYGRTKVSAESFTCGGPNFSRYPEKMKQRGDRFFTEGINNTLLHLFVQQPYEDKFPGVNAPFGNEFDRNNTWFSHLNLFIDYLKRCNLMLQQGLYVADAAYFIGEDAPKMTGICDPALPKGYSFDYINGEVILSRAEVKDGYLVLPDGMKYRILVLPKLETMRPGLLRKIVKLVNDGAVVLGPAPKYSPSLQNYPYSDQEVRELAAGLWGDVDGQKVKYGKRGKGMILSGMSMEEAFELLDVKPDLQVAANDPVMFIHRTLPEGDIYFVSNQSEEPITINPAFRIAGKSPELWNAIDGKSRDLKSYVQSDGVTKVPLKLCAYESTFVVFRKESSQPSNGGIEINYPIEQPLYSFSTPWTVTFDAKQRGPINPVQMSELKDWTTFSNDSIKYYSGAADYKNEFKLSVSPKGKTLYLNLGKLTAMAKVKVNGIEVGGAWTAPWRVDISDAVKKGKNTIEITVVNTWVNRLIGDQNLPENLRKTWCLVNPYKKDSQLQPSGLIGPVTITSVIYE